MRRVLGRLTFTDGQLVEILTLASYAHKLGIYTKVGNMSLFGHK